MTRKSEYRKDIQALRGLSVLAVVLFHSGESLFRNGYLGVDVFFVISGFVVTPLILRVFTSQNIGVDRSRALVTNLVQFYKRRFYRLAPAMAAVLIFSAILITFLGTLDDHKRFARQGIATILLSGNLGAYRYSGNYFEPNPNPLVHTWSLSVEEQIYIFLPLFLSLVILSRKHIKKIIFISLSIITVVSFSSFLFPEVIATVFSNLGIQYSTDFSFYSAIDRIWQFTIAGVLYILLEKYKKHEIETFKFINVIVTILFVVTLFGPILTNSQKINSTLASFAALVIIYFRSLHVLPGFLSRSLEWLGDRSYSIYLVHMPLLYIAQYSPVTELGKGENRIIQSVLAVVLTILCGGISYSKIENRFRNYGTSSVHGKKGFIASLSLTFVIPLSLFMTIDLGTQNRYFGLDRNLIKPAYAGFIDPSCRRDSKDGPPCMYKNVGATKTVLLVGDSHAGHISQAVIDAAKNMRWNAVVWTHSGCRVQFEGSALDQDSDDCIKVSNQMKAWVSENKPDAIIVSQFVHHDSSQEALRRALKALSTLTPSILLIENNPIFPDGKEFMVSRPLIMQPYNPPKAFPIQEMQFIDAQASKDLAIWAKKNRILTMDFSSLFCDNTSCNRYSDSGWLYQDDGHLSVLGAALTIPQLRSYLANQ
jgi:peptidoglycan/LPS O-acetylase OafA/YrhL